MGWVSKVSFQPNPTATLEIRISDSESFEIYISSSESSESLERSEILEFPRISETPESI